MQLHVEGAAATPVCTATVQLALLGSLGQLCGWYNLLNSR